MTEKLKKQIFHKSDLLAFSSCFINSGFVSLTETGKENKGVSIRGTLPMSFHSSYLVTSKRDKQTQKNKE